MTITTTTLTRAAGLAAVAGGLLFIAVQIKHPHPGRDLRHHDRVRGPRNHEDLHGRPVADRHHRHLPAPGQADRSARPDRLRRTRRRLPRHPEHPGHRLCSSSQPLLPASPATSTTSSRWPPAAPRSATSARCRPSSRSADSPTSSAASSSASPSSGRNVLARWAAALLAVGAVATVATFVLPELIQRLFAIPVSVALVGLGYSLWREQRTQTAQPLPSPVSSQLDPAGAR